MALSNTELRNGTVFQDGGSVFQVLKFELRKQGRGSSNVKVRVRDLNTGAIVEKTYGGNQSVEEVELSRSNAQYLYNDGTNCYFMESDSYDQFEISMEVLEDIIKFIKEGQKVVVLKLDGKPTTIEIPKAVTLEVTYTEPSVKGDTAGNALKDAELETGLKVRVPLFIGIGDVIKVNTETGTYSSKA